MHERFPLIHPLLLLTWWFFPLLILIFWIVQLSSMVVLSIQPISRKPHPLQYHQANLRVDQFPHRQDVFPNPSSWFSYRGTVLPNRLAYRNPLTTVCFLSLLLIIRLSLLRTIDLVDILQLFLSAPQSLFILASTFARIHGYDGLSSFLLEPTPSLSIGHLVILFTIASFVCWLTSMPSLLLSSFSYSHELLQRRFVWSLVQLQLYGI